MTSLNDLDPIYESKCDFHSKIIFCKNNKKGGKVFKYKIDNDTKSWQLVQCLCCQFEEKSMNEEWINSIKQQMDIDKSIDETNNRLSIQPFFSRFCENTQKISVFASVWPQMNTILAWNFDIEKETFVRSECSKECCQEIVYPNDMTPPSVFDEGAQSKQFARFHRDSCERQLMCLSITWYDNENGQMEYFSDSEGDIGRYEWKEYGNFFEFADLLDIRVLPHKYPEEIDKKQPVDLWADHELILLDTKKCEILDEIIYFCYDRYLQSKQETKIEKFIFDPMNLQFCRIECPCCTTSKDKSSIMYECLNIATYDSCITNTKVSIQTDFTGIIAKMITKPCGNSVQLEPSPIQNYSHLSPEEFKYRRGIEEKTPKMTQILQKVMTKEFPMLRAHLQLCNVVESWIIRKNRLASDGVTKLFTYVFMNGSIIEKEEQMENVEKPKPEETFLGGIFRVTDQKKDTSKLNEEPITDYDLSPEFRNYCNHTGHFIITAFNNKTKETGHYVFNPETAQFHHSDYCPKCPPYENGAEIQPCDPIMTVESLNSRMPYWITTYENGRLVRKGSYSSFSQYNLTALKIEAKMENINEIKTSLRAENTIIKIPTSQQSPLDIDLTPKYKFCCEHIDDCIIYAYNNYTKTRGFYVFNSITGHLNRTTDCGKCRHKVLGDRIEPMTVFMSVMSPYSKWPIMLTTDKSGKLMSLGFQPESNKFEKIGSLSINMKKIKRMEVLPQTKKIDEGKEKLSKFFEMLKPRFDEKENEYCSDDEDEWSDEEDEKTFETEPVQNQEQSADKICDDKEDDHNGEKYSEEHLVTVNDLTPKYRNYCIHTGHFIITALNNKTKSTDNYVFNPETAQFHQCNYCPKCPSYEKGFIIPQPDGTIISLKTSKSEFPYWIKTNYNGRLTVFEFDSNNKYIYSEGESKIQKKVENINEIKASIRKGDPAEIPISPQFPLITDLIPMYSAYCKHIKNYLIYALNNYTKTRGFYIYNLTTGHLEQHKSCPDCSHSVMVQYGEPMKDFMSVISPYSKWPIVLSTDESGKLLALEFQPETNTFENMSSLSITMKQKRNIETEEDNEDSKPTFTAIEPSGIDDDQNSMGSNFSYLENDLSNKLSKEDVSDKLPEEKVIQENTTATDESYTCNIS